MQKTEHSRTETSPLMNSFPFRSQPLLPPLPAAPSRGLAALAEAMDALFEPRRGTGSVEPRGAIPFGSCPTFKAGAGSGGAGRSLAASV